MLKKFTGFKGHVAFGQIGSMQFALVASNPRHLAILWQQLCPGAELLDPAGVKKAIVVQAADLPATSGRASVPASPISTPTALHPVIEIPASPEGVASES